MNILVVGAGLSGATIARTLADADHNVHIIDKRGHVAGNAYDYIDEHGFRIHKYGPHLFHTNNREVVDWLSQFTTWVPYQHKVKALLSDGSYVTLPPNVETKEILGKEGIIDTLFRPYSKKMWNMEIEELDPTIISRIPVRDDYNELYFPNDRYQCLPSNGYEMMVKNIIDHPAINVSLKTSFDKSMEGDFDHVFNSMPIDEYFEFCFGSLPYRSIRFTHITFPAPRIFPVAVVNFTHHGPQTRVTEWAHLPNHGASECMTALTYEEPCDYKDNHHERYYPVKDAAGKNRSQYKKYRDNCPANVTFIGRCGQYVYLDMDMAVASSLAAARRFIGGQK